MGPVVLFIALAGLVLPITLILSAVLVDILVLGWASLRWGHDSFLPKARNYYTLHVGNPVGRFARAHHLM